MPDKELLMKIEAATSALNTLFDEAQRAGLIVNLDAVETNTINSSSGRKFITVSLSRPVKSSGPVKCRGCGSELVKTETGMMRGIMRCINDKCPKFGAYAGDWDG